jgi:hypothetical protein
MNKINQVTAFMLYMSNKWCIGGAQENGTGCRRAVPGEGVWR